MSKELELDDIIICTPGRMSGAPCFRGTRVPLAVVKAEIEDG